MPTTVFMHVGYTGTMVCADLNAFDGGFYMILLTNRVYPTDTTGSAKIIAVGCNFFALMKSLSE